MFECLRYFGRVMSQKCQHLSPEAAVQKAHACIALQPGPVQRPVRTSQEWRPEPLLCKRFNVPDPFKGRQAPSKSATQFKSDLLALPDTAAAAAAGFLPGPPPLEASAQLPGPPSLPQRLRRQLQWTAKPWQTASWRPSRMGPVSLQSRMHLLQVILADHCTDFLCPGSLRLCASDAHCMQQLTTTLLSPHWRPDPFDSARNKL